MTYETVVLGDKSAANWTPPPWEGAVMKAISDLRQLGIEPTFVEIPAPGEFLYRKFYGVPARMAPGEDRLRLVLDVCGEDGE